MVFRAAWAECHDGRGGHAPASRQPGLPDLPELGPSRRAGRWAGVPPMAGCVPGRVPVEGAVLPLLPGGPRCPPTPRSAPTRGSVAQQAGWGAGPSSCCHLPEPQCRARMGRSQAMPQSAGPGREARGWTGPHQPQLRLCGDSCARRGRAGLHGVRDLASMGRKPWGPSSDPTHPQRPRPGTRNSGGSMTRCPAWRCRLCRSTRTRSCTSASPTQAASLRPAPRTAQ